MHLIANQAQKRGMGTVSSKNSKRKRVSQVGRNFAPGDFCPQSRHLVRFAKKIGEVRFSTKSQIRKRVFWKREFEWAFVAKLSKVFVWKNFAPERTIQPIRPIKDVWGWFHQKIPTENVFFRMDETSLRETFAPNRAIQSVWPIKQVRCDLVQKLNPKICFSEKRIREGFEAKLSKVFVENNFAPERTIQPIRPRKEVWGWFHEKNPIENVFLGMDEASLRDTFAPNCAIQSVWPRKQVRYDLAQKFKPKS